MLFSTLREILAWLAAAGIGIAVLGSITWTLFRIFSEKWLQTKFDKQLETHKHAQQRELEKLRLEINTQFDRISKLHQHEFEVLPTLWTKLSEAFGVVANFVSPIQSYPDLNRMSNAHLEEFLSKSELESWQRAELMDKDDKTSAYQKEIFWHRLRTAKKSCGAFHNYLITNGIFLQSGLKSQLTSLSDLLWAALDEKELEEECQSPRAGRFAKSDRVRKDGQEMLKKIESDIYARLWRETKLN